MTIRTVTITTPEQREQGLQIRKDVFVLEQNVPIELEVDEHEETATHVVAYDEEGTPLATGRIREYAPGVGKMERIAVSKKARTGGYGRAVMQALEEVGRRQLGVNKFVLEAQVHAQGFYEKLGYVRVPGEPFLDAGILHVKMEKDA